MNHSGPPSPIKAVGKKMNLAFSAPPRNSSTSSNTSFADEFKNIMSLKDRMNMLKAASEKTKRLKRDNENVENNQVSFSSIISRTPSPPFPLHEPVSPVFPIVPDISPVKDLASIPSSPFANRKANMSPFHAAFSPPSLPRPPNKADAGVSELDGNDSMRAKKMEETPTHFALVSSEKISRRKSILGRKTSSIPCTVLAATSPVFTVPDYGLANICPARPVGKAQPPALPKMNVLSSGMSRASIGNFSRARPSFASAAHASGLAPLKPLFWAAIPTRPNSVWEKIGKFVNFECFDENLLSTAFQPKKEVNEEEKKKDCLSNQPGNFSSGSTSGGRIKVGPAKFLRVLDERKAHNLAISFRQFRSPANLHAILTTASLNSLDLEQVTLLLQEFPSPELQDSMNRLDEENPELPWDTAESYLVPLANLPWLKDVLICWKFALQTPPIIEEITRELSQFKTACESLVSSQGFASLLRTLLSIGNRMNSGTSRGCAKAFSIDSLLLFDELKSSSDSQTSLLSFAVKSWKNMNAQPASRLMNEIAPVISGKFSSIQELENEVNKLVSNCEVAIGVVPSCMETECEGSKLEIVPVVEKCENQIKELQVKLKDCRNTWQKVIDYLAMRADSSSTKNSTEFFDLIRKFLKISEKYYLLYTKTMKN